MSDQTRRQIAAALDKIGDPDLAAEVRLKACETLVKFGHVNAALPCLRDMVSDPTCGGRARLLQRTGEYLVRRGLVHESDPSAGNKSAATRSLISDDSHSAFWRAPDEERAAESLVIVFTGVSRQFWISLDILHRILRRYVGQAIYLRDFRSVYFLAGVGKWGGYDRTVERLRQLIDRASAKKVYTVGNSAGGFAAIKYGLALSVDGVLALSPRTDLRLLPDQEKLNRRFARFHIPQEDLDLLPEYDQASRLPCVTVVYGGGNKKDAVHAERLAHLPDIDIKVIPDIATHSIMTHLLATGRFDRLIRHMLAQ